MMYKEAVLEKEIQKLKEENSSLKLLLEALSTKVAQMQIKLNTISEKVGVNTSYVLANQLIDSWLLKGERNE